MEDHETALRKRAEDILGKAPEAIKEVPPEDIKNLIHELQVHQIELEMQNEELRRAQMELEAARDRYSDLYDFAPVGYFTLSNKGMILDANLSGASLLGVERGLLKGQMLSRFLSKDDADIYYLHLNQLLKKKAPQTCELKFVRKDGKQFHGQIITTLTQDAEGKQFRTSLIDATERKRAEDALRKSEEYLRDLYENAPNAYFSVSAKDGSILSCNSMAIQLLGYDRRTIEETKILDLYADTPGNKSKVEKVFKHFKEGKDLRDIELEMLRKTGEPVWVSLTIKPVKDREGNVTESRSMVIDITERKRSQEALRDSERRFQALTALAPVGIYLTDKNGNYQYVNERWCEMTGMSNQETWGDGWIKGLHPDDRDLVSRAWKKMAESESKWGVEYRFQTPQGETTFVLSLASPMRDPGGQVTGYIGANLDITHLKRTEEQLRVSLDEKDVLLKEIHHRVKNNLQIIAGLLNMSSMEAVNKEAKNILQDARGKVYAMALIHSQLYQNDRFDAINIANHINRLVVQLSHAYRDKAGSVHTVVEPAEVYVTLNQAIPCGLVANELLTNSLKHAFEGREQGTIKVHVVKNEDDMITIKVKDDGIGIPETVEIGKPKTLGITLLKALVRQLKGTLQLKRDKGTEAIVQFKAVLEEEQHAEDSDRRR